MAWTNSKIGGQTVADILAGTTAMDLNTDTLKAALFDNTITPDNTVAAASFAYDAGVWLTAAEVDDGTEWDAAGEPLTSVTLAHSAGVITLDAADTASGGSSATLANVFGVFVYDDTITTPVADQGVSYNYLGGTNSVTNGTFTVVWAAAGVFTIDVS